jgi:hypothetical protein
MEFDTVLGHVPSRDANLLERLKDLRPGSLENPLPSADPNDPESKIEDVARLVRSILVHLFHLAWLRRLASPHAHRIGVSVARCNLQRNLLPSERAILETRLEDLHRIAGEQARHSFQCGKHRAICDTSLRWALSQIVGETIGSRQEHDETAPMPISASLHRDAPNVALGELGDHQPMSLQESPEFDDVAAMRKSAFRLLSSANAVLERFDAEHRRLLQECPERAATFYASLVPSSLEEPDSYCEPRAMKYLRDASGHINKWTEGLLLHMSGIRRGYEIGVGPGYLFRMLMDVYRTDMLGCDLDPAKNLIFRDLREELGISNRVDEHEVKSGRPIPIPSGCDAVLGFWTVFTESWNRKDHAWFLDFCRERLVGDKRVFMLFNAGSYDEHPEIFDYYCKRGAEFPWLRSIARVPERDKRAFCIVRL